MSNATDKPPRLLKLEPMASRLGTPVAWLRDEVEAGRIPALRVGRSWLLHIEVTEEAIVDRLQVEAMANPAKIRAVNKPSDSGLDAIIDLLIAHVRPDIATVESGDERTEGKTGPPPS